MLNENLIRICSNFANFRSLKKSFTFIFKANNEKKATLQGVHIPKHCQHYPPQLFYRSAGEMKKHEGEEGVGCAVNSHMEIYLQHIRMLSAFRSIFNRVR